VARYPGPVGGASPDRRHERGSGAVVHCVCASRKRGADPLWSASFHNYSDYLAPVDDVMKRLIASYGAVNDVCSYLAKGQGTLGRSADQ
jgi:hypothetical protein